MGWLDAVAGIFKPISDVIDHVLPSGDAKMQLQQKMLEAQMQAAQQTMEYEKQLLAAQTDIIKAEANSQSWIARNWRPITMLIFVALIVARWCGWSAPNLSETEVMALWDIVKVGLGGYVVGRSVEKVAPSIVNALKK